MPKYQIQIPEPCNEDWSTMTPKEKGRFCALCKKTVIDYTNTSDLELARLIYNNDKICGRFKSKQLDEDLILPKSNSLQKVSYLFSLVSFLGFSIPSVSQKKKPKIENINSLKSKVSKEIKQDSLITIKGVVEDERGSLPGASILIKNTRDRAETNFDGEFSLEINKKKIDKPITLVVTYIGFEQKEIIINKLNYSNIHKIVLEEESLLMGAVVIVETKRNFFQRVGDFLFGRKDKSCSTKKEHKHK